MDTKLVHFGARDYDASVGKWIQKDPIFPYGATTNTYEYGLNDPVSFIDPSGLYPDGIPVQGVLPGPYRQGATLGAGVAVAIGGAVLSGPAIGVELGLALGAAQTAGTGLANWALTNPVLAIQLGISFTSGFGQGLTETKLTPSGTTTPVQFAASYFGKMAGSAVRSACEK